MIISGFKPRMGHFRPLRKQKPRRQSSRAPKLLPPHEEGAIPQNPEWRAGGLIKITDFPVPGQETTDIPHKEFYGES